MKATISEVKNKMSAKTLGEIGRVLLELLLIWVVYDETGWATALALLLITIRCELVDYHLGRTWRP